MKTRLGELANVPYLKAQIQVKPQRDRKHGPEPFTAHQVKVNGWFMCDMQSVSMSWDNRIQLITRNMMKREGSKLDMSAKLKSEYLPAESTPCLYQWELSGV